MRKLLVIISVLFLISNIFSNECSFYSDNCVKTSKPFVDFNISFLENENYVESFRVNLYQKSNKDNKILLKRKENIVSNINPLAINDVYVLDVDVKTIDSNYYDNNSVEFEFIFDNQKPLSPPMRIDLIEDNFATFSFYKYPNYNLSYKINDGQMILIQDSSLNRIGTDFFSYEIELSNETNIINFYSNQDNLLSYPNQKIILKHNNEQKSINLINTVELYDLSLEHFNYETYRNGRRLLY